MVNVISGGAYARAWGLRFALFAAITLVFPFIVYELVLASGATKVSGASGALAMVLGIYLKPVIYTVFAASLARISISRAKTVGMPGKVGIFIALLALADIQFWVVFGSHWGVAFSLGVFALDLPYSFLAATIAILTLSLMREPKDAVDEPYTTAATVWFYLLVFLAVVAIARLAIILLPLVLGLSGFGLADLLSRAIRLLNRLTLHPGLPPMVFAAASVYLVYTSRKPARAPPETGKPQRGATTSFGRRRP